MKLEKVNCRYGAPMGRHEFGLPQNCERRTVRVFRIRIDSGGYDEGGAYWGIGEPLYCATDGGDYRRFIRASNRVHACLLLDLAPVQLKGGLKGPISWLKWSAVLAYMGTVKPVLAVHEFGKFAFSCASWFELCRFAQYGERPEGAQS